MSLQTEPTFEFRFSFDDIRSHYATAEDAWNAGDFMLVSEWAPEHSELRACAVVMAGLVSQGLEQLDRIMGRSPRGELIRAFALWLADRPDEALAALAIVRAGSPERELADRLQRLTEADEIRVITNATIMPMFTQGDDSARQPISRYGQFKVSHYATQFAENAWPQDLNAPFDTFIDSLPEQERPDFIFSLTPQWPLPRNFERVRIPRVIWCHDTDVFFCRGADNLAVYDVRLTCTSQEHFELQQSLGRPCFSTFMTDPSLSKPFPKIELKIDKDIDVLFTGAALRAFHSDKSRFMYLMSALAPKYRVCVVDGHMPEPDYFDLLSRARFLPIINRYSGQSSPRWRDALAQSTCVLYPRGSGYGNIGAGCFPYCESSIVEDFSKHIDAHHAAEAGSLYHPVTVFADVQRHFLPRQASRAKNMELVLKIAAFAALIWPHPPRTHGQSGARNVRPRAIWFVPPIDNILFGQENIIAKIGRFADDLQPERTWDDKDFNNAAAINMHLAALYGDSSQPQRRQRAYALLERGLWRFPRSLLLRFNAAHWRFFESDQPNADGDWRFEEIIEGFGDLEYSPTDSDVGMAVTFYERDLVFPYYDYCQLVLCNEVLNGSPHLHDRRRASATPADVLLAAAHGYLGLSAERRGDLMGAMDRYRQALAIYPDNLPLMRQRLKALLRLSEAPDCPPSLGDELARAFFDCVAKYPTVLLSELYDVVPALGRLGPRDAVADALVMWARLGTIAYSGSQVWFDDAVSGMMRIADFEPLFPSTLRERLACLREKAGACASTSQFEMAALAAMDFARSHRIATSAREGSPFRPANPGDQMGHSMFGDPILNDRPWSGNVPTTPRSDPADGELEKAEAKIAMLSAEVAELALQVEAIRSSTSWKLTSPLRRLMIMARTMNGLASEIVQNRR
jgi:hypothetical protein